MKTRLTLKPGQKGTKSLSEQYGDQLICVRYRYDRKTKKRLKTVELIIEETDWHFSETEIHNDLVVGIQVGYEERDIQKNVKQGGGVWDKEEKLWLLKYSEVMKLGLGERIVKEMI